MGAAASIISDELQDQLPKDLPGEEVERINILIQEKVALLQSEGKSEVEIRAYIKELVYILLLYCYFNSLIHRIK